MQPLAISTIPTAGFNRTFGSPIFLVSSPRLIFFFSCSAPSRVANYVLHASECTFCQTKLAKGDITSYRVGDVVRQVKEEVLSGCSEIWLSSTDNGCYGLDIGSDLPELVNAVSAIRGDFMIRVGMMNPMYMPRIGIIYYLHMRTQTCTNSYMYQFKVAAIWFLQR